MKISWNLSACNLSIKIDKCNMVLIEAVAGGRPGGLIVEPPLVAHDEAGNYTGVVRGNAFYEEQK